jgi:undecaprenyl-diphosphatase
MMIIELLKAALFGAIEGFTEWLPISSTGHMILADRFINLNVTDEFFEMFLVVIQLGAVLAVAVIYRRKLFPVRELVSGGGGSRAEFFSLWSKIIIATLPLAAVGLLFDDKIDELFYNRVTVANALIFYGVIFIIFETVGNKSPRISDISGVTRRTALYIGMFQLLSLIPGTSRSGATILGAMLLGASRSAAAEFTFFLALPAMAGAGLLKTAKLGFSLTGEQTAVLFTGAAVAFLISLVSVRFLVGYVKKHDFKPFGWYRIALGTAVLLTVFFDA